MAALAVVVSVASWVTQHQALEEAKEQFAQSGPQWAATAKIGLYDNDKGDWLSEPAKRTNVPYEETKPPVDVFVLVKVTNTGRTAGSVAAVAVQTASDSSTPLPNSEVLCSAAKGGTEACELPKRVDVGQTVEMYARLSTVLQRLKCNTFASHDGVELKLRDTAGVAFAAKTGIGLALSGMCPTLPAPPAG